MSGGITDENNSFDDYFKTDNFDDSELQSRLYAEIYYDFSNVSGGSEAKDAPRTIQFDSHTVETNVASERLQRESEEQPSTSDTTRADSQKMLSTNRTEFTQVDTLAGREMNPVTHNCDSQNLENPSATQGKENNANSPKKRKVSKRARNEQQESSEKEHNDAAYSKYNVLSKNMKKQKLSAKQIEEVKNSSDSEDSICEVPVPPKPKPPLIDLQDSDEEANTNSDLILKKWANCPTMETYTKCREFKSIKSIKNIVLSMALNNRQNIDSKNKNTDRSYNTVNPDKSVQTSTHVQEISEDIVLNCSTFQRGAKTINEIKQLSKNAGTNPESKSIENTNQNCKRKSPQNMLKGNNENNTNFLQETSTTSRRKPLVRTQQNVDKNNVHKHMAHIYNMVHKHMDQNKTSGMESHNPVIDLERQCNNEIDNYPKQKRQCTTIQQNNQDVMPQDNNGGEKNYASQNEYFKPMPEEMRNYYNSNRGQENFDVEELQRGMSKDPRMWAILDEDLMPSPSNRHHTRFWNIRCSNCHQEGHPRFACSSPRRMSRCYMCGMKGHTESRCSQKMCLTCGKQQYTFRNTCESCRILYCTMCNSVGHEPDQCPDLWRRYHQTIDMSSAPQNPGNMMKPARLLYCCNCTKRGHESSTCREYRWSEHFPTPAAVTNYTDGPTYMPYVPSSSGPDPEIGVSSFGVTENETIPNATNVQCAETEDVNSSANVNANLNTLTEIVDYYVLPTSEEEAACFSQMDENLKSSSIVNKIWPTVKTKLRQTKVDNVTFDSIIYCYGHFDKNHEDARMILKNLSTLFITRRPMLNNIINHKVAPDFLKILFDRAIKFEVKIGFTYRTVSLQLLAMKDYIEYLYDLLCYWLNLPDDEKNYGIDLSLSTNPVKMFNVLKSRMLQLEKSQFTCYADHIGGTNDPRWIYDHINNEKITLEQERNDNKNKNRPKNYHSSRWRKLWRLQTKLLIIVNTEPKPNHIVRNFRDVMKRFELERYRMGEKLDTATYLRLLLLYNQLFAPHTSRGTYKTLRRIKMEEKKNLKKNLSQMQQKPEIKVYGQENFHYDVYPSSTSSSTSQNINLENYSYAINNEQRQQKPEIKVYGQENFHYDVCPSSTSSSTSQNINLENYSYAINNEQNNEILVKEQNVNNISFERDKTNRNSDEIIIIEDISKKATTEDSQIVTLNIKPTLAASEDLGRNKVQLSTSEVNIKSNVFVNKQNVNVNNTLQKLSKSQKKQRKKQLKDLLYLTGELKLQKLCEKALKVIKQARAFKVPHMMNAADETQRQINCGTIKPKHVRTLSKLILLEEQHQHNINMYCDTLKK